ncbi:MAG: SAM-dependent methyltransferase [Gemmatimonadetes bacterium]|nr:SAM-dependent methyltransferase [Gemmatimonadota bacterium]
MPRSSGGPPGDPASSTAQLFPLVLLFVGSGAAALIYEVVWFQMLSLVIGSSAISLGVLLATFMGGMCLGSISLPHVVRASRHPLRVYAAIEGAIGLFGLVILFALPWVEGLYVAIGRGGFSGLLIRAAFSAICLLPPTVLMGATLPAVSRWVKATPRGVSWLGFFYWGNIAGAVLGCLLAGFYLLRLYDIAFATYVAASVNVLVAGVAFLLSGRASYAAPSEHGEASTSLPPGAWTTLAAIALSGLTALGAEVVWTRNLSLILGGTVYTFSLILAAFLMGLGIGSAAGSFFASTARSPRLALGWCQLLLMMGLAWAAVALSRSLPYWPTNPALAISPWFNFQLDLARCLWTVLPGAILWGASFPLALASIATPEQDPGHLVGRVYAANTVGAILGSIGVSLFFIGAIGTQAVQRLLIGLAGLSALLVLVPAVGEEGRLRVPAWKAVGWGTATVAAALLLTSTVAPVPGILVAYGRYAVTWLESAGEIVYVGEGTHASLAVTRLPNGTLNYHNAGKVQASSEPQDMRLQRMLGHFTTLSMENPRSVLVIGLGAGVTAGAVTIDPRVEKVTIAELEPLVPKVVSEYFSEHNFSVVANPKVEMRIDDGRHFLLTTDETFDAITSDPLDPWVKGAGNLYTREFWELVKGHLNRGGVVTVFVQLYESGREAVRSEIATFVEAFPNATVWANTLNGRGYDLVLMGQVEPTRIDVSALDERLQRPEYAPIRNSLAEIGFYSVDELLGTYAADGTDLGPWIRDAEITRDRNLRLQYLAGLGVNRYEQDAIYREIISYRTFPDEIVSADPGRLAAIRELMEGPRP